MHSAVDVNCRSVEHRKIDQAAHARAFVLVFANPTPEPVIKVDRPNTLKREDKWELVIAVPIYLYERARGMAERPNSRASEDPANPYSAPTAESGDPADRGEPEATAVREAHRKEESYVKGLAIINTIYFLLFGAGAIEELKILMGHLTGVKSAPWIVQPGRFAMFVFTACAPIAAFCAACGFLTRKRWALGFELAFAACWFCVLGIEPLIRTTQRPALEFIGLALANLALAAPMMSAWHLRRSFVFDIKYADVIAATRHAAVWPKLSLRLVLIAVALCVTGGVLVVLASRR